MKDRSSMEKFALFPFSLGCTSESSVAVTNTITTTTTSSQVLTRRQVGEESPKIKGLWGFLARQGVVLHSLKRSFKGFSQLFVYKEEIEEVEMEMEIGYPTDVKHVTHIASDGSTKINPVKGWENSKAPELLSLPSISIKEFELAMAAQPSRCQQI